MAGVATAASGTEFAWPVSETFGKSPFVKSAAKSSTKLLAGRLAGSLRAAATEATAISRLSLCTSCEVLIGLGWLLSDDVWETRPWVSEEPWSRIERLSA